MPDPTIETSSLASYSHLEFFSLRTVRDLEYYFSDGNCILKVGNTLFNLHHSILCQEDSVFNAMLQMPQGQEDREGMSDDSPITLVGDTARQFRNLIWALYSPPFEIERACDEVDVAKIFDVAVLAAKYAFKRLEIWACKTLVAFTVVPSKLNKISEPVRVKIFPRILKFACQTGERGRLKTTLVDYCKEALKTSKTMAVAVMDLTDEVDIPILFGLSRFELLSVGPAKWDTMGFSVERKASLLYGYHCLVEYWHAILTSNAQLLHSAQCKISGRDACRHHWRDFWRKEAMGEQVSNLPPYAVPARLREIARHCKTTYYHSVQNCRSDLDSALTHQAMLVERDLLAAMFKG